MSTPNVSTVPITPIPPKLPLTAAEIKAVVIQYCLDKNMAVNAEVGLCKYGKLRADILALTFAGDTTVIEIKSSVSDFKSDKKWHNYLPFANKFYFAMSPEVYAKVQDSIPKEDGIGVMLITQATHTYGKPRLHIERKSKHKEIEASINIELIIRLAFRNAMFNRLHRK